MCVVYLLSRRVNISKYETNYTKNIYKKNKSIAMPLFGKKDSTKKSKRDSRDPDKQFTIEDKYNLKELLGT